MSTPYDNFQAFDLEFPYRPLEDLRKEFPEATINMKYHVVPTDTRKFVKMYVINVLLWKQNFALSVFKPEGDNVIEYARNILNQLFPITD